MLLPLGHARQDRSDAGRQITEAGHLTVMQHFGRNMSREILLHDFDGNMSPT